MNVAPSSPNHEAHRWVSWVIPLLLLVASIVHAIIKGVRTKSEEKRKEALLRIFVGYLIGGLCLWLAIIYLFLPKTFSPGMLRGSGAARRVAGFSSLAFSVGGIISATMKDVAEQRVAVTTFTVFMLGVAGVQLYTLKGREKKIKIYNIPVIKLVATLVLIVFASIAGKTKP